MLVNSGLHKRKNFSENYPQLGHAPLTNVASAMLVQKSLKNAVLKGHQITSLPGAHTYLEPTLAITTHPRTSSWLDASLNNLLKILTYSYFVTCYVTKRVQDIFLLVNCLIRCLRNFLGLSLTISGLPASTTMTIKNPVEKYR